MNSGNEVNCCSTCGYWKRAHQTCTCPCIRRAQHESIILGQYGADRTCDCRHYIELLHALACPELVAYPEQRCELCAHWQPRREHEPDHICLINGQLRSPHVRCSFIGEPNPIGEFKRREYAS